MAELKEFKCPACGGALEFNTQAQKMKCPYCDTEFEVDALKSYAEELEEETADNIHWEAREDGGWQEGETDGMRVYVCNSCGGEIVGDENTAAGSCPFCGNPVVMQGQFEGALKPDCVIPFKLDKKAAKDAYFQHIKGRPLLPKVFKEQNHIDEIKGIYIPFWLYGAEAHADMRYRGTRVRAWSDSNYRYTETSFYSIRRKGKLKFEGVPVDGSSKIANELTESIEPFDLREAVDFHTAYLAGYLADKYDVDEKESEARANERIRESTDEAFRSTVSGLYTTVVPESRSIELHGAPAKYALYPVWLLNTTWREERFHFIMNGQTGKMTGNLPVDRSAFGKWFLGVTVGVFALSFGLMSVFGSVSENGEIPAERQLPRLVDEAELLDGEDARALERRLDEISERYQCDVAVVTKDSIDGADAQDYADDFYDYNGYGYGEGDDGILFLLAMEEREWAMSTYGYGTETFTDSRLSIISDEVVPYLSDGDYGEAFFTFANICENCLDAEEYDANAQPFDDWEPVEDTREYKQTQGRNAVEDSNLGFRLLISLIIGLVTAAIATGVMRGRMKTVRSARGAAGYVIPGSLSLSVNRDTYLYRTVTKTPIPKDNGSHGGGGSSTHTSSSGRSHGGSSGSF